MHINESICERSRLRFPGAGERVYASQVTLTPPSHRISSYFIRVRGAERIPTFAHRPPYFYSHEMILK